MVFHRNVIIVTCIVVNIGLTLIVVKGFFISDELLLHGGTTRHFDGKPILASRDHCPVETFHGPCSSRICPGKGHADSDLDAPQGACPNWSAL